MVIMVSSFFMFASFFTITTLPIIIRVTISFTILTINMVGMVIIFFMVDIALRPGRPPLELRKALFPHPHKLLLVEPGIDGRVADRDMTQVDLHCTDIIAVVDHIEAAAMPQHVRVDAGQGG